MGFCDLKWEHTLKKAGIGKKRWSLADCVKIGKRQRGEIPETRVHGTKKPAVYELSVSYAPAVNYHVFVRNARFYYSQDGEMIGLGL